MRGILNYVSFSNPPGWLRDICKDVSVIDLLIPRCDVDSKHSSAQAAAVDQRNVKAVLEYTMLSTILITSAQAAVMDAFVFLITKSNLMVGIGESIIGATGLASLAPVALVVDRYNRGSCARWSVVFAVIGLTMSLIGIHYSSLGVLFLSLVAWGIHEEIANSAMDCILIDSVAPEHRTKVITKKAILTTSSVSLATALQLAAFITIGNEWTISGCQRFLWWGYLVLTPLVISRLVAVSDTRYRKKPALLNSLCAREDAREDKRVIKSSTELVSCIKKEYSLCDEDHHVENRMLQELSKPQRWVPYLVALSDLVRAIGSGMTVKFFFLFFMNEYGFSPVQWTALSFFYNLLISLCTDLANRLASIFGRAWTSFALQLIACAFFLGLYHSYKVEYVVSFFLLRGSCQNAFSALDRAIIADTTRMRHRGKWIAVESLNHVTWSGSAFLGGFISDHWSYRKAFLYTIILYIIGIILFLPVVILYSKGCDEYALLVQKCQADENAMLAKRDSQRERMLTVSRYSDAISKNVGGCIRGSSVACAQSVTSAIIKRSHSSEILI